MSFRAFVRETSDVTALRKIAPEVELVVGDLNVPDDVYDACTDIKTIIHAAAIVSFHSGDRDELLLINGEGTANLVNGALAAGVDHLIHLSSVAALPRKDGGEAVTLARRWPEAEPNTGYAESKVAAEREVWRGQAEGLKVSVVYPSTILGTGDFAGHNTPGLWRRVAGGQRFYPAGSAGFVGVRDVIQALLHCLDEPEDGTRLLLNAANLSWREFLTLVAESIGVASPTTLMPRWQSNLLWPLEGLRARLTGDRPQLTRETARSVQANYRYDGSSYTEVTGNDYEEVREVITRVGRAWQSDR